MGWEFGGIDHEENYWSHHQDLSNSKRVLTRTSAVSNNNNNYLENSGDQVTIACRHFFTAWLKRSESLRGRWQKEAAPLSSFDHKIHHLRNEISGLAAQDTQLFRQLFALQQSIDELKDQLELVSSAESTPSSLSPVSSSTSLDVAPTSIASAPDCWPMRSRSTSCHITNTTNNTNNKPIRRSTTLVTHTSFVRQRVSYPPSARNRCRRSQTLQVPHHPTSQQCPIMRRPHSSASSHGGSSSLDSGIHTSDHEIFV